MKRREFITLLGGGAAWPLAARAQQREGMRRIGVLLASAPNDPEYKLFSAAFTEALKKMGWEEARNIQVDFRSFAGEAERIETFAKELVALHPDVIVGQSTSGVSALVRETRTIPIVFMQVADPVTQGLMKNLARPEGNVTGFTNFEPAIGGKWIQLLKEFSPELTHAALPFNPDLAPFFGHFLRSAEAAGTAIGVKVAPAPVYNVAELELAVARIASEPNSGLIIVPHPFTVVHRHLIIALAVKHRLPSMYPFKFFTTAGGLASYGIDVADVFRDAASYVDRILRGASTHDLPVQAPTRFELVINRKTARTFGLVVPPMLQALANEIIE